MLTCEPGQVRKEAAAAGNTCAGMSLVASPPNYLAEQVSISSRQVYPLTKQAVYF